MKHQLKDKTILVVDDDRSSLILLCELLEPLEAQVLTADSGHNVFPIIHQNHIDLILLDLRLGDTTGFALLPEIRKIRPNVCVIAQTAFAYKDDERQCRDAGFNDYISKPILCEELYLLIDKHLS